MTKTLLEIRTSDGERSKLRAYADAVLLGAAKYGRPRPLHAISMIGNEQIIRAIASGCAMAEERRITIEINGPNQKVTAKWDGKWNARAQLVSDGIVHAVALPHHNPSHLEVTDNTAKTPRLTVISQTTDRAEFRRLVYRRLAHAFTTPLIPLRSPGQPPEHTTAAETWAEVVCEALFGKQSWRWLEPHPDQKSQGWGLSGILTITQEDLDKLVCGLVRVKKLVIPDGAVEAAAA